MTHIVTAEKYITGGSCLAKIDGKTVFIPETIPGETVEIEITDSRKDFDIAKIVKILEASPFRIESACPYYGRCGGCNMRHIEPGFQQKLRAGILSDLFEREKIEVPSIQIISGQSDSYRCRFQLHDGGLKSRSSSEIIPITDCPVATGEIREWMQHTPCEYRPRGRVHVFGDNRVTHTGAHGTVPSKIQLAQETVQTGSKRITGKSKRTVSDKVKRHFSGTVYTPENICTVVLQSCTGSETQNKIKHVTFDVRGFFQSNMEILEKTIAEIYSSTGTGRILDMYSGAGTFSVFLADKSSHITLVEHNRDALVFAEQNLSGVPRSSYGISGSKWAAEYAERDIAANGVFESAVVDPPRTGMEKQVRDFFCKSSIPHICSVSCDPATHARDCAALIQSGYKLKKLYLLDFYPQTSHIESLAVLEKSI